MSSVMKRDAECLVCPHCGLARPKKLTLKEKIQKILTLSPDEEREIKKEKLAKQLAEVIDDYLKEMGY